MARLWGSIERWRVGQLRPNRGRAPVAFTLTCGAVAITMTAVSLTAPSPSNRASAAAAQSTARAQVASASSKASATNDLDANDGGTRRFTGRLGADLSQSLLAAGVPPRQAREYVAILARSVPLANGLSVDDRFDLILLRGNNGELGELVYAGLDRIARADLALMKWTDGKQIAWVNAESDTSEHAETMRMPVTGRITSGFGERFHPILGYERFHDGVDLSAPVGTAIVAAAEGRVISAGWAGGYGRAVEIAHADGVKTRYGHMSRIAAYSGEQVRGGEVIGYVGSTGLSTGPHLHFEVMKNGRPVNPLSIKELVARSGRPEGAQRLAFENQLRQLLLTSQPSG